MLAPEKWKKIPMKEQNEIINPKLNLVLVLNTCQFAVYSLIIDTQKPCCKSLSGPVQKKPEKTQQSVLSSCLRKTGAEISHDDREVVVFDHTCGLQSFFEKLRFRDGLVYHMGIKSKKDDRFCYG